MPATPRSVHRTYAVARETHRWREAARQWVRPNALPATGEQLTAQLVSVRAPAWLVWRINARLRPDEVVRSVEEIVALCGQQRQRRSVPGMPYAG